MFETKTSWEDTGHDCAHCGGEVLKRTDSLPNGTTDVLFQCRTCGCQWGLDRTWLRVGNGRSCQKAYDKETNPTGFYSRRLLVGAGIALLLLIARLGGIGALRFLLPLFVLGLVAWTIFRMGKEYQWW